MGQGWFARFPKLILADLGYLSSLGTRKSWDAGYNGMFWSSRLFSLCCPGFVEPPGSFCTWQDVGITEDKVKFGKKYSLGPDNW